jgi:hypothetical protein
MTLLLQASGREGGRVILPGHACVARKNDLKAVVQVMPVGSLSGSGQSSSGEDGKV